MQMPLHVSCPFRAESAVSEPDSALEAADDSSSGRGRKSQKTSGGQVASQRHVATEQKRRDKINEGYDLWVFQF